MPTSCACQSTPAPRTSPAKRAEVSPCREVRVQDIGGGAPTQDPTDDRARTAPTAHVTTARAESAPQLGQLVPLIPPSPAVHLPCVMMRVNRVIVLGAVQSPSPLKYQAATYEGARCRPELVLRETGPIKHGGRRPDRYAPKEIAPKVPGLGQ